MVKYELSQGWSDKPLKNLATACYIEKKSSFLHAKFEVKEPSLKAVMEGYNCDVFKDSCVELFISLDKKNYYNFEISCIGAILGQHGMGRFDRMFLDEDILSRIRVFSSLGSSPIGVLSRPFSYTLEVEIPKDVFVFDTDKSFDDSTGNIYKCADESPTPHYMYLYEVKTEKPDFHRPEFFGKL